MSGLKSFSLDETSDTEGRIIFGQNGSGAAQQWKIAGIDSGINGDNIILFAASPLGSSERFKRNIIPISLMTQTELYLSGWYNRIRGISESLWSQ